MKKRKCLASAFALALAAAALFVFHAPAALAQEGQRFPDSNRKLACGCYICGTLDYVVFEDTNCAGILAEDACGSDLANRSSEERASFCQKIKAKRKVSSFRDSCPSFAPYCESAEKESELPPTNTPPQDSPSRGGAYPPADPDEDGLGQGFGGLPPVPPSVRPPKRLVYLVPRSPGGDKPGTAFTVWLDRSACVVPIAGNNRPSDPSLAKYVVQGRVLRSKNLVSIVAEARELANDRKLGKVNSEAQGEDASAVAAATRSVAEKLKLPCIRQ